VTTQDEQEGERRLSAFRGIVLIGLSVFVVGLAAAHGYDWKLFLLAGVSLAGGATMLGWALRR
jgi:hypothetical protein